jgi:hypothetical protein
MSYLVEKKVDVRKLDDVDCSNIAVSHQIKRMVNKFPSMRNLSINCYAYGTHYTNFKFENNVFTWTGDVYDVLRGRKVVSTDDADSLLDKDSMNKLINDTFNTMLDSVNETDLVYTPEELLAFAEEKLKALLAENPES